ncbi:MAG: ribulose-phosphate 3-epimerase [Candidatus Saganbacteria bacterium]|uniref:Ribulose-phosphate 3-epimerase n=1 Tax=Candidatus Saganbacteria bacterium TaxID=2575572 RepID=A0A833L483_UNCSA|nr:MAG: ribulose-phosphate 3-epimerase [Candidatus Saganbacteria bacterium]
MIKIAPSILSADFSKLGDEIKAVEKAGADLIHIDVMDGHFVPNITIGPLVVKAVKKITNLPLDVHLMIENPDRYIPYFAKAGADIITIHVEASKNLIEDLELIKRNNAKAGVAVNPGAPIESVFNILDKVQMILLMTVNPGFEGQKFLPEVLPKIKSLRQKAGNSLDIEVDGGINAETAKEAVKAGANILVAGSAIFYSSNYREAINKLKR